jgi:hypothetical protein
MSCRIDPVSLTTPAMDTAVPLRTALRSVVVGNCSTQYPLEAKAEAAGAATVTLPYLLSTEVMLRAQNGTPLTALTFSDNSAWTSAAVLDGSCRITLEVRWNEVDVSSTEEAQALMGQIDTELNTAKAQRDRMRELMLYQKAYALMRSLAQHFQNELSNGTMQELRAAALESAPALESMILGCDSLSIEERLGLLRLHGSLWVLGQPEDWQRPDGTPMTLEDHLGEDAAGILAMLNAILAQQGENPPNYEQLYADAEAAVAALENKRILARAQLAPWLNP